MERLGTDRSTEITHFPHMRKLRRGRNEKGGVGGGSSVAYYEKRSSDSWIYIICVEAETRWGRPGTS